MPAIGTLAGASGYGRQPPPVSQSGIPTNGLLIQLDASNSASYSGSGTTWTDITGGYNATLVNAPTFVSASPKYFSFDGVNQYVNIPDTAALRPSIGGTVSAVIWAYVTSYDAFEGLISKQFGSPSYDGFSLVFNTTNRLQINMNGGSVNGIYVSANTNIFSLNTWTMFTIVIRFGGGSGNPTKGYVNTTEVISVANAESSIPVNTAPLRLVSGIQEGTPYPACRVGSFYYYNRVLSTTDINSIFTTTRTRFGV